MALPVHAGYPLPSPPLSIEYPFTMKETIKPLIHKGMELVLPAQGRTIVFVSLSLLNTPSEEVFTTLPSKIFKYATFLFWGNFRLVFFLVRAQIAVSLHAVHVFQISPYFCCLLWMIFNRSIALLKCYGLMGTVPFLRSCQGPAGLCMSFHLYFHL